ncbi:MAG: hypothetical protein KGM15_00075 [Pseudomonadota bacterium]|nr:hypothetical protein [Pseudomonadota bacterium]
MPKITDDAELHDDPDKPGSGEFVFAGTQVQLLEPPSPWPFHASPAKWAHVRALVGGGAMQGWLFDAPFDSSTNTAIPIDVDKFCFQCWRSALDYGAYPHYLAAVAKTRSDISIGLGGLEHGPFDFLDAEWKDNYRAPPLDGSFALDSVFDWRAQCDVAAVMSAAALGELSDLLARTPSAVELWLAQMIGPKAAADCLSAPDATFKDKVAAALAGAPPGRQTADQILLRYKNYFESSAPAAPAEQAPPLVGKLPRNFRNNNPGNLRDFPFTQKQPGYVGADSGHYGIFNNVANGFRAANRNLDAYVMQGLTTPTQIAKKWAPLGDGGNNPEQYAKLFKTFGNIDANTPIGSDFDARAAVLRVIARVEGGVTPYLVEQIAAFLKGGDVSPVLAGGSVRAVLSRLTNVLAAADAVTRPLIEKVGESFSDASEGDEKDPAPTPPVPIAPPDPAGAATRADFVAWFRANLPDYDAFPVEMFFFRGNSDAHAHKNSDPPASLWPNILKTAQVLAALKTRLGSPKIVFDSVYRNRAYNSLIGGKPNSQHLRFGAVDFVVQNGTHPIEWAKTLKQMRNEGVFAGGVGTYPTFVHVDTRGRNADW